MVKKKALVSVSNKNGVTEFVKKLSDLGYDIISTGGTANALKEAGVTVVNVADYTGAPEMLDGRVKTLHPKIHGGLLGRETKDHQDEMTTHGIWNIDMVVVNLYPFEETIRKKGVSLDDAIENIDIGGPSMLRSAAKNHERVTVVVDPLDYDAILSDLLDNNGVVPLRSRQRLAVKAFSHTAAYDQTIATYLASKYIGKIETTTDHSEFPTVLETVWQKNIDLRYGENPHQQAAFYVAQSSSLEKKTQRRGVADARVLQGKALSYNNIMDLDAALACVHEFDLPAAVVVKHTNPCGVARGESLLTAYLEARACDPVSSFGGIVALNREVDKKLALELTETFLECVVAPAFSQDAQEILSKKKNLRLLEVGHFKRGTNETDWTMRSVQGGLLVQNADFGRIDINEAKIVTQRIPTKEERAALGMAWRVVKHVKSNAILFATENKTAAIGAGQMSRVDSSKIATLKATMDLRGSVVASDAFFPFRDGVDVLAEAGASCVIQPGGSIRDQEVIDAANEHGMAMLFTGMRHFRH